jgi:molybdopterin-guanine dinucleotide biosynthesis protein A
LNSENLHGLVLCGGNSSRMGADKSMLSYHGIEQRYHLYHLLTRLCSRSFISCSKTQTVDADSTYETITDDERYAGNGPLSGLLTAFERFPSSHILAIGCDYPFLKAADMSNFLASIPDETTAAAFYDQQNGFYIPVLAWYSQQAGISLKKYFQDGNSSLQRFLLANNAYKYLPADSSCIRSVDTYEEFVNAREQLQAKS